MLPLHVAFRRGLSHRPLAPTKRFTASAFTLPSLAVSLLLLALVVASPPAGAQTGAQTGAQPQSSGMVPFSINPNAASGLVLPSSDNVLVSANASHTYTFTITDTSSHSASGVTLSISGCTGAVSSCSVSPTSVSMGAGFSSSATVTYHTGASGTGTVTLMAHWPSQLNTYGTLNVTLPTAVQRERPISGIRSQLPTPRASCIGRT